MLYLLVVLITLIRPSLDKVIAINLEASTLQAEKKKSVLYGTFRDHISLHLVKMRSNEKIISKETF